MRWREVISGYPLVEIFLPSGPTYIVDAVKRPLAVQAGWRASRFLELTPDFGVAFFQHVDGRSAGWLVGDNAVYIQDIERALKQKNASIQIAVTKAVFKVISDYLIFSETRDAVFDVGLIPPDIERLWNMLLMLVNIQLAVEIQSFDTIEKGEICFRGLKELFNDTYDFISGVSSPNSFIDVLGPVLDVKFGRTFPLDIKFRSSVFFGIREDDSTNFIAFHDKNNSSAFPIMFFASGNVIVGNDVRDGNIATINTLFRQLATIFAFLPCNRALYREPARQGSFMLGYLRNVGHGIWDELQALDRVLAVKNEWSRSPVIYVAKNDSGAILYGPLEDIYPELDGLFYYSDNVIEVVTDALKNGRQIFRVNGQYALRQTRDRIMSLIARHGEMSGLANEMAELSSAAGHRIPVIVFGLRLSNRYPADFLGFYIRLAEAVVLAFNRVIVVFDGLNIEPDGTIAARIFNGQQEPHLSTDSQMAIDNEHSFVAAFEVAVKNLPVTVVNCVAMTLRDNLYWLSRADFFIAPNGGGLAKLRWALDVPGYVLSSQINLRHCLLVNVYADPKHMEGPFNNLYMNTEEEVQDIPRDPPRSGAIVARRIPYEESFTIKEDVVIPRILALIKNHLDHPPILANKKSGTSIPAEAVAVSGGWSERRSGD